MSIVADLEIKPNFQQASNAEIQVGSNPTASEPGDDIPRMLEDIQSFLGHKTSPRIDLAAQQSRLESPGMFSRDSDLDTWRDGYIAKQQKVRT